MIVLLMYYSDGSGMPEIMFFPKYATIMEIAQYIIGAKEAGRTVKVYEITDLNKIPTVSTP